MRNYQYGARAPFQNLQLVKEQFNLSYEYHKKLVLIECRRRTVVDLLYRRACPDEWAEHEAARKAVLAAVDVARMHRSNGGDLLEPDKEMKAEQRSIGILAKKALEKAREREKASWKSWSAAKKRATPRLKTRLMMCDRGKYVRGKRAYNEFGALGLYSSTREVVHESVELASKMSLKAGSLPRIPVRDGSGLIAVRLQGGGLSPTDATDARDTRFQLEIVNAATWQMVQERSAFVGRVDVIKNGPNRGQPRSPLPQPIPGSRRSTGQLSEARRNNPEDAGEDRVPSLLALAKIRVRSESETRKPVWATFPIVMHRPLPPDSKIKRVLAVAKRIGPRLEWKLLLTVDDGDAAMKPTTGGKVLAVNLGWRTYGNEDGGLRVGYAVGSDGHREDVRVPPQFITGMDHVRGLGETRAKLFEQAKGALKDWIDADNTVPVWMDDEVKWIYHWRSPKKIVILLNRWKNERFSGDDNIYDALVRWKKQDVHLWRWESGERERLLRMRKDVYRCIAARWAENYARIVVTDMDLRVFAQKDAPEDRDSKGKDVRVSQRMAAPSELRAAIKNGCSTRGTRFEEIKAVVVKNKGVVGMTQMCHACKEPSYFEAATILVHKCACGAEWDQDYNHCMNLLASEKVMDDQPPPLAQSEMGAEEVAAGKQGRWQKRLARKNADKVADSEENKQVG